MKIAHLATAELEAIVSVLWEVKSEEGAVKPTKAARRLYADINVELERRRYHRDRQALDAIAHAVSTCGSYITASQNGTPLERIAYIVGEVRP